MPVDVPPPPQVASISQQAPAPTAPAAEGEGFAGVLEDLGFLFSSVSAGMAGTTGPQHPDEKRAAAARKDAALQFEQDQLRQKMFNDQVKNLETFTKLAKDVPKESRGKLKEIMMKQFQDSPLAEVMDLAFEDDSVMELATQMGLDPQDEVVQMLGRSDIGPKDKMKVLTDRADEVLFPEAMRKIGVISASPEKAFPPDVLELVMKDGKITPAEFQAFNDSIMDESMKLSKGEVTSALRNIDVLKAAGIGVDGSEMEELKFKDVGTVTLRDGTTINDATTFMQGNRRVIRNPDTNQMIPLPSGARFAPRKSEGINIKMAPGENEFQRVLGKSAGTRIAKKLEVAEGARTALTNVNSAKNALDKGVIVGFGSDFRMGFGRLLGAAGFGKAGDEVANTEAFMAVMGNQFMSLLASGAFGAGTGISDRDLQTAQAIVGGNTELTEKGIRLILRVTEAGAKASIKGFREERGRLSPEDLRFVPDVADPEDAVGFGRAEKGKESAAKTPQAAPPRPLEEMSQSEKMKELKQLLDAGVITQEEFDGVNR
jgi:hypothetical protein